MLHETFAEPKRFELFDTVGNWLDANFLAQQKVNA